MRRMLTSLALVIAIVGIGLGGMFYGQKTADDYWMPKITQATELLQLGTYHNALTNTRACVLALDSSMMRFLSNPSQELYRELEARYNACNAHWDLSKKYNPNKNDRILAEARWEYEIWKDQLDYMVKLQIVMLTAINEGRNEQAEDLYKKLIKERESSKDYRDRIDKQIQEAWNGNR